MTIDNLYKTYFHDVYRFLLSLTYDPYLAEDLLQETFVRAYLYLESYDDERVKTWLFTVANHVFIDYVRKQKRMKVRDEPFFQRLRSKEKSPQDQILWNETIDGILHILQELPQRQKQAVLLRDFHDFTYREGARVMKISLAHFKVLLFRGRQAIRKRKAEEK